MIELFDQIVDAHEADNFPIKVAYGNVGKPEEIKALLDKSNDKVVRFLIPAPLPVENELAMSTGGDIQELFAWMVVFSNTPLKTVRGLRDWFFRLGFKTENDVLGFPGKAPYVYSTINIYYWWPVGGVEMFAQPYGETYMIEQYTRISFYKE